MNVAEIYCISLRRYVVNDIGIYCIPVRWYLMIDTGIFRIPIRRYLMIDTETYCIPIRRYPHNRYRDTPHTNIVISDKWVLFGMWIQKSDAKRIVPTEMISIETYAGEPVSKHSDSEYAYANAIGSALPRTT